MARVQGTIPYSELSKVDTAHRNGIVASTVQELEKTYGVGTIQVAEQANGDWAYIYDYADVLTQQLTQHNISPVLSAEEIAAINHGRVALCNLGRVHVENGVYTANPEDVEADPALAGRVKSINAIEALLKRL